MIALMRLLIFGGIALAVLYLGLSWYFRAAHRERMERDWETAGRPGNREAYVEEGMSQYQRSLQRKLLWLVIILPVTAVVAIIWITNFN